MKGEIGSLTGLRGIAALWVCAYHTLIFLDPANGSTFSSALAVLGTGGYLGVDIFFVLSGFVLAHNYGEDALHSRPSEYCAYLRKRLARIYPVHLATLALVGACVFALGLAGIDYIHPEFFTTDGFIRSLALIHAWQFPVEGVWNGASWSISAEWAAYLAFPLVAVCTLRIRTVAAALSILGLLYAVLYCFVITSEQPDSLAFGMIRVAVEFPAGLVLYRIWQIQKTPRGRNGDLLAVGALIVMVLGSGLLDTALAGGWSMKALPIFACAIVYGLACSTAWARSATDSTVAQYLGRISYSFYMIHTIVMFSALSVLIGADHSRGTGTALIAMTVSVFLSLALADLCYRFIEQPCRRLMVTAGHSTHGWFSGRSARARSVTPADHP